MSNENNPSEINPRPKQIDVNEKAEYVPFGPAWERQLKKLPKDAIIKMFKNQCLKRMELVEVLQTAASHLPYDNEALNLKIKQIIFSSDPPA